MKTISINRSSHGGGLHKGHRQKSLIDLSSSAGGLRGQTRDSGGQHRQSMMDLRTGGWSHDPGVKRHSMAVENNVPPHLRPLAQVSHAQF